jgi:cell division protein FtsB
MVVRTRLRSVLIPLVLFCVSGAAGSYFVWHAQNGERGIKAKLVYKEEIRALTADRDSLVAERKRWERRIEMMQAEQVDRDLLEEEARLLLGRAGKTDLLIQFQN